MDKEELQRLYDEAGNIHALARLMGIGYSTAYYHLQRAGIETHTRGWKAPRMVEIKRGPEHHNWKGGTYMHSDGYVYQYAPDHPAAASAKGYVLQHRLIMEQKLDRFLKPDEDVHHDDEDKTNNDPANLVLTERSPHMAHHRATTPRTKRGTFAPKD